MRSELNVSSASKVVISSRSGMLNCDMPGSLGVKVIIEKTSAIALRAVNLGNHVGTTDH